MEKRIILCEVDNEYFKVKKGGDVIGAAGSHDDVILRIRFGEHWAELSKRIVWFDALDENPVLTVLTPSMLVEGTTDTYDVPVPAEPKAMPGDCWMTIRGVTVADGVETSATATAEQVWRVLPSRWDPDASESQDITPSQADQFEAQLDAMRQDIIDAAAAADAKEAAQASAAQAATSATNAAGSASQAASSATSAAASASQAAAGATSAAGSASQAANSASQAAAGATSAAASASQAANSASQAASSAAVAVHPPIIANNNWWVWDATQAAYVDTQVRAEGVDGETFKVLGRYSTLEALEAAHPSGSPGDAWDVGTFENNEIYNWDVDAEAWVSVGKLSGPPGPQGPQGPQGETGPNEVTAETATDLIGVLIGNGQTVGSTAVLPADKGGTGITENPSMLADLGSAAAASVFQPTPRPGVTGTLPLGNGGTGQTTAANALYALVNGSGAISKSELADGDIVGIGDISANAGKKLTLGQLLGYIEDNADIGGGLLPQLAVTGPTTGSTVVAVNGSESVTFTESGGAWTGDLTKYGTWTVTAAYGGDIATDTISITEVRQYSMELRFVAIYGVSWDGTSTTAWTRTDDAAGFTDPVPYVAGASNYGSPFDDLAPWKDMTRVTDSEAGEMVKIPKFWYKLTQSGNGMKIQIADAPTEGFSVCPACMDRGDGAGERDYVLIGRYHCASDYKSKTGVKPVANITRSAARSSISNLGSKVWMADWAVRFTLFLLYLVEFADWNTQAKIGKGCGDNSATGNMGYTDSMPYHTGTTQSSRDTFGLGTQYRNIEGLWDNVRDWIDGCYNSGSGLMIILNPANSSDSAGGTSVGTPSNGYPSKFAVKDVSGTFPLFIPTEASGSDSTYSCDN